MTHIGRIAAFVFLLLLLAIALAPWAVYHYSLSQIDAMPEKARSGSLNAETFAQTWSANEKELAPENVGDLTPYWMYEFIFAPEHSALIPKIKSRIPLSQSALHCLGAPVL